MKASEMVPGCYYTARHSNKKQVISFKVVSVTNAGEQYCKVDGSDVVNFMRLPTLRYLGYTVRDPFIYLTPEYEVTQISRRKHHSLVNSVVHFVDKKIDETPDTDKKLYETPDI